MIAFGLWIALQGGPLPEGPPGWNSERIDFPLDFAPELDFEGVEDLRFAPGMFTPDSDSYFSYAFGIRLEGRHEVDGPFLQAFLETYYRGLCGAVGQERFPGRDPQAIRASVRDESGNFVARVDLYDAFGDGRELDLRIEVDVHRTASTTELLGLASPLAGDAIWADLHAIRARWEAVRAPPLGLNHVFAVVDEVTWNALEACRPLHDLAVFERRTTERGDLTYTGLYFYGRNTYFEFLKPDPSAGFAPGRSGVAFGCDRDGGLEALRARLEDDGLGAFSADVTRRLGDAEVPWFHLLGLAMPAAEMPLDVFAMEYDAKFLARWHGDLEPRNARGVARRTVLARYAAALGRGPAPLRDVTAIDVALDEAGRERWIDAAAALGFETGLAGSIQILRGPDFVVRLHPAAGRTGLSGFEVSLAEPVEREALSLGAITIRFSGSSAHVDLGQP